MTEGIYLLLGSNLGDKRKQLSSAIDKIARGNEVVLQSKVYETAAWGNSDQPSFYNQVISIRTSIDPHDLLHQLLNIELEMGRIRDEKWGARHIDIDILYFNDLVIKTDNLTIPHPEIQNRRFTLVPMVELAAEFYHPVLKKTQQELLTKCADLLEVIVASDQ
jgi:2-amino-4-hydroxy-6-hydroxymethyldihydropteridine diphosphokinase